MLIRELIVRHVGPQGAVHARGVQVDWSQVPAGLQAHQDDNSDGGPVAGDLLVVSAPTGLGLREHLGIDLPVGATVMLLLEVELAELPVGRVLAALAMAKLQVVEACILSDTPAPTVAVVATRSDDVVVPAPYLAHDLEPGSSQGPAVIRRLLGEHALEGLAQRARERALLAQAGDVEARFEAVSAELKQHRDVRAEYDILVEEHKVMTSDLALARAERDAERKRMGVIRSSRTFRVASRLARVSGLARGIVGRSGGGGKSS